MATIRHSTYRCALCKSTNLRGVRNGDLVCDKCNSWADPDDPQDAHKLEFAEYRCEIVGWKSNRECFVYEPYEEPAGDIPLERS